MLKPNIYFLFELQIFRQIKYGLIPGLETKADFNNFGKQTVFVRVWSHGKYQLLGYWLGTDCIWILLWIFRHEGNTACAFWCSGLERRKN